MNTGLTDNLVGKVLSLKVGGINSASKEEGEGSEGCCGSKHLQSYCWGTETAKPLSAVIFRSGDQPVQLDPLGSVDN